MTSAQRHTEQEEISVNLTRLDARVGVLENGLATLGVKIDSLFNLFNASRQTNWPLIISVVGMFCTLAVGVWYFIEIKSQVALAPVQAQAAISTTERAETRKDLDRISESLTMEIAARRSGFAALQQQVVEAETQHRMRDAVSNIRYESVVSHIRQLFVKAGMPPPDPASYQPSIGREINTPIPNN